MTRTKTAIIFDYTLDGSTLTCVSEEKDLGVIITSTLLGLTHLHYHCESKQASQLAQTDMSPAYGHLC